MLPSLRHPQDEDPDPQQQGEPRSIPVAAESHAQVLVVEDDAPMARMIAVTLARLYRVTTASDGQEGIEQALVLHPDLILCDVSMPRMSGEQLVKVLRKHPDFDDVPILALSEQQHHIRLLRAGAQDYLEKPFNREELRVRVANLLMIRQARRVLQREVTQQSQNLADKRESEQLQLALKESETNFRFLTNSMPQVMWTARADGQVDYYNQRWFDYTGLTYEHSQPWGLALHPDDLQQCREAWRQVIATGTALEIKYRFKRASDGVYRWHLGRALPVWDTNGNIIKWFGTSTDIDDQIRTEEALRLSEAGLQEALHRSQANYAQLERTKSQLRAIIDASQEAMLFLSPGGRPLKVNACFTDFFGLDDTTVLSQSAEQLTALLKGLFEVSGSLDQSLTGDTKEQEHIFREQQVQVGPGRREFDFSSLPVMNVDQTYIGRLYVWHDATRERELDRAKSGFVSMVSHELRTPLTSIKGYVDLILTDETLGELSELQREFLGIIQNNARRLVSLVNDLLDLSGMESGKLELHRKPLDITLLIRELLPSFQPGWDASRQTFTLHLPEKAPMVLADADRLMQILSNLLSNAHKYTPNEGHIDLSVEIAEPVARVKVTDSGIGLSTEEQAQLFTRFYRAHNAMTEAGGGTGLGLVITRSLVEMQGGEMQVSSEPGHGSTFGFTLPLAQVLEPTTFPQETLLGKRILVVDDEKDTRHLLRSYLQGAGYEVMTAPNAQTAFQLARAARPDVITLDMLLPNSAGLPILELLKSDAVTAIIPVILLTVVNNDGQRRLLGATDYLDKPIEASDLLQRITTVFADQTQRLVLLVATSSKSHELLASSLRKAGYQGNVRSRWAKASGPGQTRSPWPHHS